MFGLAEETRGEHPQVEGWTQRVLSAWHSCSSRTEEQAEAASCPGHEDDEDTSLCGGSAIRCFKTWSS